MVVRNKFAWGHRKYIRKWMFPGLGRLSLNLNFSRRILKTPMLLYQLEIASPAV